MDNVQKKSGISLGEIAYGVALVLLIVAVMFYVKQPKVAVIDLKTVAKELGVESQIRQDVRTMKIEAKGKVEKLRDDFKANVERLKQRIAQAESDKEKTALREDMMVEQQKAEQVMKRIEMDMAKRTDDMIQAFHARLKPVIEKVAAKRRVQVVLDGRREAGVMFADSRVNITKDVVEAGLATGDFKKPADAGDADEALDLADTLEDADIEVEESSAPAVEKSNVPAATPSVAPAPAPAPQVPAKNSAEPKTR